MATLTNKFHVKDTKNENKVYDCTCYTLESEATPANGGAAWQIKNNNTVCYLGLWPTSSSVSQYSTPLKIKKNNIEYYVQTQVQNEYTVTIVQSAHQTIQIFCNSQFYTNTFTAPAGSYYTVTVIPEKGYLEGKPSTSYGYVNSDITITASPASKATYQVIIAQTANQTITVRLNNTTNYTSSFNANYGDTYTVTITPNEGYIAGTPTQTSGTIIGNITISATAATIIKCTITVTQPENGRIEVNGQTGTSFAINYGTSTKVEAIADSGYVVDSLYVDPV